MRDKVSLFWFRRDLRLEDNAGLAQALSSGYPVLPVFIFDDNLLSQLEEKVDRRVDYIHQALGHLNNVLKNNGSTLLTFYGTPIKVMEQLMEVYDLQGLYFNRDYEPAAIQRDLLIIEKLTSKHIPCYTFKDQVIFEFDEVLKADGQPYTVFTPYAKKWKSLLKKNNYEFYYCDSKCFYQTDFRAVISLKEIGFQPTDIHYTVPVLDLSLLTHYEQNRDFPSKPATSMLGVALRFGTISVRKCVEAALSHSAAWLNELIWREFFMQILKHFPKVINASFKLKYDFIQWNNDEKEFQLWCVGQTGYPLVDAGMRELNQTGFMHNRVRMVVASFLTKHLLIDWRWGASYFASKLNDYDLSANNGNWQWVAGSGCDAAPYFRVFNPTIQAKKFDPEYIYIKKWIPEWGTSNYPLPMIEHDFARKRALGVYSQALKQEWN